MLTIWLTGGCYLLSFINMLLMYYYENYNNFVEGVMPASLHSATLKQYSCLTPFFLEM